MSFGEDSIPLISTTAVCMLISRDAPCPVHIYSPSGMYAGAGGIPGMEPSSAGKGTECYISDIVEDGEACSENGSGSCHVNDGGRKRLNVVWEEASKRCVRCS